MNFFILHWTESFCYWEHQGGFLKATRVCAIFCFASVPISGWENYKMLKTRTGYSWPLLLHDEAPAKAI